jgi:hypothetical protein
MHCSIKMETDINNLQDLEFDKIIGKASPIAIQEIEFAKHEANSMPYLSKDEE